MIYDGQPELQAVFLHGMAIGGVICGIMGTVAGALVAGAVAGAGRADEQSRMERYLDEMKAKHGDFTDPETVQYGPVVGLVLAGDERRWLGESRPGLWGACYVVGIYPVAGWEYRRPISPVAQVSRPNNPDADSTSPSSKAGCAGKVA